MRIITPTQYIMHGKSYIMQQYTPEQVDSKLDEFEQALREAEDVIETNNIPTSLDLANIQKLHELILARRKDWRQ